MAEVTVPRVSLSHNATLTGVFKQMQSEPRKVRAFLGVPYAGPTARYQPPTPFSPWEGERTAGKFGAICPQSTSLLEHQNLLPVKLPSEFSENCFYLNIWTPDIKTDKKLPVMVFIHGGGFTHGFLCTGTKHATGNYGLLDAIEALKWVNQYIDNFGGDPQNITVVGESAGSMSVSWLLLSPLARGLFKRAVSQSGTALSPGFVWTPSQAGNYLRKRLVHMGLSTPDDPDSLMSFLMSQDAGTLSEQLGEGFRPVIDGTIIPDHPNVLLSEGRFCRDVDYMIGFNSDEGAMFAFMMGRSINANDIASTKTLVKGLLKTFFRNYDLKTLFQEVWQMYFPEGTYDKKGQILARLSDMLGDFMLSSPTEEFAAKFAAAGGKTYVYYFTHRPDFSPHPARIKADHAMEILFMIGSVFSNIPGFEFTRRDKNVSRMMMQRWVNFATNGDPNGCGLDGWPQYELTRRLSFELGTSSKLHSNIKSAQFNFWQNRVPKLKKMEVTSQL